MISIAKTALYVGRLNFAYSLLIFIKSFFLVHIEIYLAHQDGVLLVKLM